MSPIRFAKGVIGRLLNRFYPQGLVRYYLLTQTHHYEPELWLVPRLVRRGSYTIDIGGNEGVWSTQMSRFASQVHTFEPNPICIAALKKRLPANARLYQVALSATAGTVRLRFDPRNTGVGTIEPRNNLKNNDGITAVESVDVKTARLDDFTLSNISLVKIDVEGHEEAVLAGAMETLDRERPVIICEIEERHNAGGFGRIRQMLEARNYRSMAISHGRIRDVTEIEKENAEAIASAEGINNFVFVPAERAGEIDSFSI